MNTNNSKRLIHYVNKTHNLQCGIFGNISDDLGDTIKRDDLTPLVKIAYAYARRAVAAGLLYQGIFSLSEFKHVYDVFKAYQIDTGHTVEFQEAACDQAVELLMSYDKRLNKQFQTYIIVGALDLVKTNMDPKTQLPGAPFSYEYVVNFVVNFVNSQANTSSTPSTSTKSNSCNSNNSTGCCVFMVLPLLFVSMFCISNILDS